MQENRSSAEKLERIVFMGFMGAGKSTVGSLVARRLGWRFVDADAYLEAKAGHAIGELFSVHGEQEFRRMEAGVVEEVLRENRVVVALGGGAVEMESTFSLLTSAPATCLVFLDAPLPTLILRCEEQPSAAVRPILNDREGLEGRWQKRLPLYQRAHLIVDTVGVTPEMVTERILDSLADGLGDALSLSRNQAGREGSR